ncbi:HIPL1 protein-like [Miscanthus floridulus]|uniref:HIPL1 protein-like n=1 Tax=Miscanthus floridulus TaxID=154761 RepID=UPI0034596866
MNDSPFVDLTDRVLQLVGIAFHPEFATNGRFFVSYTCDNSTMPGCASSCSSATENGSMLTSQYHLVVSEFSAKGGHEYSSRRDGYSRKRAFWVKEKQGNQKRLMKAKATRADPAEVRRVFSMALPLQQHTSYNQHVGQILFWPNDNDDGYYLYLIVGGGEGDLCKDNTSYCGKIVKFNIDNSTPPKMEIFAVGLSNPMGCSFDSQRSSDFYCANVNQEQYEQVYLISNMTGTYVGSSSNITPLVVIDHGRSAASGGAPSIVGGRVYRGSADPSMSGRYLYMYGSAVQAAIVGTPESIMPYATAPISAIWYSGTGSTPCGGSSAISGQVLFLGGDNNKDLIILTKDGVFLLFERAFCAAPPPQLSSQSPDMSMMGKVLGGIFGVVMSVFGSVAIYYYWNRPAAGGQAPQVNNNINIQLGNHNGAIAIAQNRA